MSSTVNGRLQAKEEYDRHMLALSEIAAYLEGLTNYHKYHIDNLRADLSKSLVGRLDV